MHSHGRLKRTGTVSCQRGFVSYSCGPYGIAELGKLYKLKVEGRVRSLCLGYVCSEDAVHDIV